MAKTGGGKNGGSTRFWRKTAKKYINEHGDEVRTGRRLKAAMAETNHPGMLLPIHVWLFRAAGIPTPVLDAMQKTSYNSINAPDSEQVEDAIIISEENLSATI